MLNTRVEVIPMWTPDYVNFLYSPGGSVLTLTGAAGGYASAPDSAALDILGDIDLQCRVGLSNWASGSNQVLISKWDAADKGYSLSVDATGHVVISTSPDGAATVASSSAAAVGFPAGKVMWVRAVRDVDNGAGGHTDSFYTSPDGVGWTALGAPVVTAGVTSVFANSQPLQLGAASAGGVTDPATGSIHRARVYGGAVLVAEFNPVTAAAGAATFVSVTGETYTVHAPAVLATYSATLYEGGTWFLSPHVNLHYNPEPKFINLVENGQLLYGDNTNFSKFTYSSTGGLIMDSALVLSGTALAGSSKSITLPASASEVADAYAGATIDITGGAGAGQTRQVTTSRKNLDRYSQDFSQAGAWALTRITLTPNAGVAPDGTNTLTLMTQNAVGGGAQHAQSVSTLVGVPHTVSRHYKAGTTGWVVIQALDSTQTIATRQWFNLTTGQLGGSVIVGVGFALPVNPFIIDVGNGVYRCGFTYTPITTTSRCGTYSTNADLAFAGSVGDSIYAWGAQHESGITASAYIKTLGAAAVGAAVDTAWSPVPDATSTFEIRDVNFTSPSISLSLSTVVFDMPNIPRSYLGSAPADSTYGNVLGGDVRYGAGADQVKDIVGGNAFYGITGNVDITVCDDAYVEVNPSRSYLIQSFVKLAAGSSVDYGILCYDSNNNVINSHNSYWITGTRATLYADSLAGTSIVYVSKPAAAWNTDYNNSYLMWGATADGSDLPNFDVVRITDIDSTHPDYDVVTLASPLAEPRFANTYVANSLSHKDLIPVMLSGAVIGATWHFASGTASGVNSQNETSSSKFYPGTAKIRLAGKFNKDNVPDNSVYLCEVTVYDNAQLLNDKDPLLIQDLFYKLAPVHLVLENLEKLFYSNTPLYSYAMAKSKIIYL
jgi:hypothetical protein